MLMRYHEIHMTDESGLKLEMSLYRKAIHEKTPQPFMHHSHTGSNTSYASTYSGEFGLSIQGVLTHMESHLNVCYRAGKVVIGGINYLLYLWKEEKNTQLTLSV